MILSKAWKEMRIQKNPENEHSKGGVLNPNIGEVILNIDGPNIPIKHKGYQTWFFFNDTPFTNKKI